MITPYDIIKIVWGDTDRKIAGNFFIKSCKFINELYYKNNSKNIRFTKQSIIKELRSHGFSNKDIQIIRQLVSDALKEESYNISQTHLIAPTDVYYTDDTFGRYSLSFMVEQHVINIFNINARELAYKKLLKQFCHLEYYLK